MTNWFRNAAGVAGALSVCALLATPAQAVVTVGLAPVGGLNVPFAGPNGLGYAYTFRLSTTTDEDIIGLELSVNTTTGSLVDVNNSLAATVSGSATVGASGTEALADTYTASPAAGGNSTDVGMGGGGTLTGTNLVGGSLPGTMAIGDFVDDGAVTNFILSQLTFSTGSGPGTPIVASVTGRLETVDPSDDTQSISTLFNFTIDTTNYAADYDGNGQVNSADAVIFGSGFAAGTGTRRSGDGTRDGLINSADAVQFGSAFGNGTLTDPTPTPLMVINNIPESISALPEPASLALLSLGGLALLRRR